MKKIFLLALAVLWMCGVFAQVESVGPITGMRLGTLDAQKEKVVKSTTNTIDSTYQYITDTLTLPIFDEFSKSRFQVYDAQPGDPNVTQQLFYRLLDMDGVTPLPASTIYSAVQTYKYVIQYGGTDTVHVDTIALTSTQIKVGDLTAYPVVYATTTVYPAYTLYDTLDFVDVEDTIFQIPPDLFQDSALIFTATLHDPSSIWLDHNAHHNYNYPINPWSLGVVTFDGLDANGYPYNIGSTSSGVADFLTSKPLDLSSHSPGDSIYMSFVVQPGGYGDTPESSDSIVLDFYDATGQQWHPVWSMRGGGAIDTFKVGNVRVTQAMYLVNGFQFRFKNYGGLSGSLDHFHLDYVHLRTNAGYQDSIYGDFAWSYPIGSLLKDYTQVPWDHYKDQFAGKMNDSVKTVVHNSFSVGNNDQNGAVAVRYNGVNEGLFSLPGGSMHGTDINYSPFTSYTSYHDFSAGYHYDEAKTGTSETFDILAHITGQQPDVFIQNDSCFSQQYFGNVYAYDDGTAEKAYGPTGIQARLAYKFTPYEADSLIGVQMHFVPSVNDVSDKLFLLSVWGDNNGVPGAVLYEDQFLYPRTPVYEDGYDNFTTYYLADTAKLPITGTFYVGWRQIDADRLNLGLDMNNDHSDKIFYSINGGVNWSSSSYDGSLMMRPLFSTAENVDLAVDEQTFSPTWEVYPNPTGGLVSIRWDESREFPGAVCRDAQGRVIGMTENGQSIDLSAVPAGMYFIQLNGFGNPVKKVMRY